MGTIYVAKTGNDSNSGSDPSSPKLTIAAAVAAATDDRTTVEIIDEGTYAENQIVVAANIITLTHTASALGRPIIDATGLGNTEIIQLNPFSTTIRNNFFLNGIEVKGSNVDQQLFSLYNGAGNATGLTVTDCFVYGVGGFSNNYMQAAAADGNGVNVRRSSFMFSDYSAKDGFMLAQDCQFHIQNCFISRSDSTRPVIAGVNGSTQIASTASFCTIVFNGSGGSGVLTVKNFGKMINCVVTASGNKEGIDSNDHSYNIVNVPVSKRPFFDGSQNPESAGTGDLTSNVTFVDGTSNGNTFSVVENYALAEGSNGIDDGITFDSVNTDIIGTVRPQNGSFDMGAFERVIPPWNDFDDNQTYNKKFGSGFEIHGTANKLTTRTFPNGTTGRQAPYFVTIPGPVNLRRRTTPYKNET